MFSELPFYEELNVIITNHAFRGYAMSYKVEIIQKKDPIKHLEASKSSIKDLFGDLLKGFKYQIKLKFMLKNTSQMEKLSLEQFLQFNNKNNDKS